MVYLFVLAAGANSPVEQTVNIAETLAEHATIGLARGGRHGDFVCRFLFQIDGIDYQRPTELPPCLAIGPRMGEADNEERQIR